MFDAIAFIEKFIPDSLREEAEQHTRARFMVAYTFVMAGLALVYNLFYFKIGNYVGGVAILLLSPALLSLPFYLRRTGNLAGTLHRCCLALVSMNAFVMFTSGGSNFSGNPWWGLAPVFATLVVGAAAGRMWLMIVGSVLFGTYVFELVGVQVPDLIIYEGNEMWVHFLNWFHYFGLIVVLVIAALVFDLINRQSLNAMADSRKEIERQSIASKEYGDYLDTCVNKILVEMGKLADGDLTTELEVQKRDAIGELSAGYNQAVLRMHVAISEVRDAVDVTADASNKIDEASHSLTEDAHTQTDKAGDITRSTSQIVKLISENADSARRTAEVAEENGELAGKGGIIVRQTMDKMEEIAGVVNQASGSIEALGRSTNEIGAIVSTIQSIAERTNLLALNAAIEASRAGEAGKGFAVIAEEVKELAGQTTIETERIGDMIEAVQTNARSVVVEMQAGSGRVNEGKALASQAGEALDRIVDSSGNVNELIQQIAQACEEQSAETNQLFSQIEELKQVTDDSAINIDEIARSANRLGGLTRGLSEMLDRFNLREH